MSSNILCKKTNCFIFLDTNSQYKHICIRINTKQYSIGIHNNSAWQAWWRDLAVVPSRHYDLPSGRVGKRFGGTLGVELNGVQDRLCNLERFIVFQAVILQ